MEGLLCAAFVVFAFHGVLCIPPSEPICTSYSGLCDISNGAAGSSTPFCICPGKYTCPTSTNDTARVVYITDQKTLIRLSYCNRKAIPKRMCESNAVAITMRGSGPVATEIVGDIACKCPGPLVLSKAYPEGVYSIREYSCGQPVCDVNSSTEPVCERVTTALSLEGVAVISEILCQCPDGFICNTENQRQPSFGTPVEYRCEVPSG